MALGQPLETSDSPMVFADQLRTESPGSIPRNLDIHGAEFAGDGLLCPAVAHVASGIADIVVAFVTQVRG